MNYSIGLEQSEPGKWLAWVMELPGCFANASTADQAIERTPRAIADFFNWRDGYERVTDEAAHQLTLEVVGRFPNYETFDGYWVNAFFAWDRRPLSPGDIDDLRWLLSCARSDLIATIQRIPAATLDHPIENERFGSISGILKHIATAERWYFDKLGLALPTDSLGTDPLAMLDIVRRHTILQLPRLANDSTVRENHGELWSPRKVARRTLWHERIHTWHLRRLTTTVPAH